MIEIETLIRQLDQMRLINQVEPEPINLGPVVSEIVDKSKQEDPIKNVDTISRAKSKVTSDVSPHPNGNVSNPSNAKGKQPINNLVINEKSTYEKPPIPPNQNLRWTN